MKKGWIKVKIENKVEIKQRIEILSISWGPQTFSTYPSKLIELCGCLMSLIDLTFHLITKINEQEDICQNLVGTKIIRFMFYSILLFKLILF